MIRHAFLLAILLMTAFSGVNGEVMKIPYRPDPPISIDGNLQEWTTVPLAVKITSKDQVVFQPENWRGTQDLSGTIHLAWRPEGLYLAAQINDDVFRNSGSGYDMFKGDHLELFIDVAPEDESERTAFGKGQFQFGVSPGDLNDTRSQGAFGKINPEVFRFPSGQTIVDATVAAQKTVTGWDVEVLIPWNALEINTPAKGKALKVEVAISDCDSGQMQQEKMMTISSDTWKFRERGRLIAAVLADSDGNADIKDKVASVTTVPPVEIFKEIKIQPTGSDKKVFVIKQLPENLSPILFIRGRLDSPKNNGDTEAMILALNDKLITGDCLVNKTTEMLSSDGSSAIKIYNNKYGFRLPYASSYQEANLSAEEGNRYARFASKAPRTDFELDLSGLLRQGENVLTLGNPQSDTGVMCLADCKINFRPKTVKEEKKIIPAQECFYPGKNLPSKVSYQELPQGRIEVKAGKSLYTVGSYFSVPGGQWVSGSNKYFSLNRKLTEHDGIIVVKDSFTNLTDKNLGIIQRHEVENPGQNIKCYLNGVLRPAGMTGYVRSSNLTSFAGSSAGGIGLAPLNDAFKIHAENYLPGKGSIGICDRSLVIGPKASYTAEWIIAANTTGSYWSFINSLRRFLDVNFKINGSLAFLNIYPPESELSVETLEKSFKYKSAFFAADGMSFIKVFKDGNVIFTHGIAAQDDSLFVEPKGGHAAIKDTFSKWRQASPGIKILNYFHCFIDSHPKARELFPTDRMLNKDGTYAVYGKDFYPLFFPTLTNKYGREIKKTIDLYFNKIKADGIFWDEMSWSMTEYHYGSPWDQRSGDIDLKTHEVTGLKSSVELVTKPWRLEVAKDIMKKGFLMGNGMPLCNEIVKLKFPCFTESAQSSFAARTHLYSPIVLGDHLSETNEVDAYRGMLKALDYGCVYYWYDGKLIPTHETLTSKMFPITPVELGPGYIIGQERIITRISGFFGWDDASEHEVFFFDENGMPLGAKPVKTKIVDGKKLSEISLWPDWSAVIVRKTVR